MRKLYFIFLALFAASSLFAQKHLDGPTHLYKKVTLSDGGYAEYFYDDSYRTIAIKQEVFVDTFVDSLRYNNQGLLVRLDTYQNGEEYTYIEYYYDDNAYMVARVNHTQWGVDSTRYFYDEVGNQSYYKVYKDATDLVELNVRTFDENGYCVQELVSDLNEQVGDTTYFSKFVFEYDENGYILAAEDFNYEDGEWNSFVVHEYTYDDNMNCTLYRYTLVPYSIDVEHRYEYDLDILFNQVVFASSPEPIYFATFSKTRNAMVKEGYYASDFDGNLAFVRDYMIEYEAISTSTEEAAVTDAVIYPNPANGVLCIEAGNYERVEIYNVSGNKVYEGPLGRIFTLDVSQYAKGLYFVKLQGVSRSVTHKLVVE